MQYRQISAIFILVWLAAPTGFAEIVRINLLQLNDVYEITPVSAGRAGGLARVATLRQRLRAVNPNTYTILAGDCLSPSALGTAKVDGERLAGRQMIAVLNIMGLDYATFGNHEFDLDEAPFRRRLAESRFNWISSNVSDATGAPLPGVSTHKLLNVAGTQGATVRIALIGLTQALNQVPYVRYEVPIDAARRQIGQLDAQIVIAITHQSLDEDIRLADAVPEIDLILGGHEHENAQVWRGDPLTPIAKADANARSVYLHRLRYDTDAGRLDIESVLQPVTDAIDDDFATARVVQAWLDRGFQGFRDQGFEPDQVVAEIDQPLDGLESSVRNRSTRLTELIARSLLQEAENAELAIYNSGAIRIDDIIPPGPVTQYDVIRILPFGGTVLTVEMSGELLGRVLDQGEANRGLGGYLQTAGVSQEDDAWSIRGEPLADGRSYVVAVNDFLVSGREHGLAFLKLGETPGLRQIASRRDVRFALIDELQRASRD